MCLPFFLFACREAPSSSTRYSPFEFLYGKQVHGPLDVLRYQWAPTSKTPKDATDWLLHLRQMLKDMREVTEANQEEAKAYSKQRHDQKAKDRHFPYGTKVLVFAPVINGKKLSDRWHSPYNIIGKVTPVTYVVDMPERHKHHRTVHVEALKPWIEPTLPIDYIEATPDVVHEVPDYHSTLQKSNPC